VAVVEEEEVLAAQALVEAQPVAAHALPGMAVDVKAEDVVAKETLTVLDRGRHLTRDQDPHSLAAVDARHRTTPDQDLLEDAEVQGEIVTTIMPATVVDVALAMTTIEVGPEVEEVATIAERQLQKEATIALGRGVLGEKFDTYIIEARTKWRG
jgi:hypothetical protein